MSLPEISRVFRSKQQAMTAYDRISRWHDWLASSSERPLTEVGLKKINVSSGEKVLEIGFGTGQALLALAETVGDSGGVHGIDISRGMVKVAKGKIARTNLSQRISLEQGNAAGHIIGADVIEKRQDMLWCDLHNIDVPHVIDPKF
jgi:demethylmenaquinone methyltransferase/2-methoxy-6-polyprenyl-1,4-benzoquinol methylase